MCATALCLGAIYIDARAIAYLGRRPQMETGMLRTRSLARGHECAVPCRHISPGTLHGRFRTKRSLPTLERWAVGLDEIGEPCWETHPCGAPQSRRMSAGEEEKHNA